IYSVAERARVQGYLASVWGISSVVGPTLGGVFSDYATWRWIFFINLPVGAAAAYMLVRRFHEHVVRRKHVIDYTGSTLLAVGCSLLILGLLEGGVLWAWGSGQSIAILATAVVLLVAFGLVERRAAEPVLPLWVLRRRLLVGANLASLAVGVLLIGLTSYVPLFAQGVLGTGAVVAGFAVAAMSMGWPLASSIAGRFYMRIGFRDTAWMGSAFILAGSGLLLLVGEHSSVLHLAAACFVIGLGLGFIASPTLVAAQSSVDWQNRGVVTGTNMFARSIGSALGIAVFGAVANAAIVGGSGGRGDDLGHVPREFLAPAIHDVFLGAGIVGVLMIGAIALVPRRVETG
ncbi:MAG: MFS transporter, partial [Nocardioidaceae bacterium]